MTESQHTETDGMIRVLILFEYCKRSFGKSNNPEMHFYVIPELQDVDNEIIKTNAVHLIDENLVRGGLDDDGSQTFPWIRRITPKGIDIIEKLTNESESLIPELHDELKNKIDPRDKILNFIEYCLKTDNLPSNVLHVAKNCNI